MTLKLLEPVRAPLREDDLQIVVLDCPIDTWNEPLTRDLFHQMIGLKLEGYASEYPYGVLPCDTTDFVATHLLICQKQGSSFEVLSGYRSVSLKRCQAFNLKFSALTLAESGESESHIQAVKTMMDECEVTGQGLRYCSSYTMRPWIRGTTEAHALLRSVLVAVIIGFYNDYGVSRGILGGTVRCKADRFHQWMGYLPFVLDGRELPTLILKAFAGIETRLMGYHGVFSPEAVSVAECHGALWSKRMTLEDGIAPKDGAAKGLKNGTKNGRAA